MTNLATDKDWKPKVGDWIVILQGSYNWASEMDQYVGKCVQITKMSDSRARFKNDGNWSWIHSHGHFRKALPSEIPGQDLLEEAKKRYPIGTQYKCAYGGETIWTVVEQRFTLAESDVIHSQPGKGCLYHKGNWAEIVSKLKTQSESFEYEVY